MNTLQLLDILSRDKFTKTQFLGVYASNQLPKKIHKYPVCLVVNSDKSTEFGSHWICFYISSRSKIEFFDSFGNPPSYYKGGISDFAVQYDEMNFNPHMLQRPHTAICGQYCIYYLYFKCRGYSLRRIVSRFVSEKYTCNDPCVYNFVVRHFGVKTSYFIQ